VADVVSFGGFIKQYEVTVNTARMKSYHVTLQQCSPLGHGNANAGGSFSSRVSSSTLAASACCGRATTSATRRGEHGGTPLLVRDPGASVNISPSPVKALVGQDGDEIVSRDRADAEGRDPSYVLAAVKERVAALNASILPRPVRVVPFYDRTVLIATTLHTVSRTFWKARSW